MIGYLRGKVILSEKDYIILDVNGVGYKVYVPAQFNVYDEECELYVTTNVTENSITLYGFPTRDDQKVFEILCEAHGIGPKTAIGFLSVMNGNDIAGAIINEDENLLATCPGISTKKAQKLILELKDRFKEMPVEVTLSVKNTAYKAEAVEALVALGYNRAPAQKAVENVCAASDIKDVSKIITKALAMLSKKV